MDTSTQPQASHNPAQNRYEIRVGNELAGFAEYVRQGDTTTFTHTETDPAFQGRGLASGLVEFALQDIQAQGGRIVPACAFVAGFVAEHPEYAPLVSPR